MEVKPGYKQTEVGTIPGTWDVGLLGDLVDPTRTIRYGIVQPGKRDSNGRYMVRGQDYSKGWVDPSELFRVSPAVEEPFANARIRAGDVLITIVGASTGRIAVVPEWLDGANLTQTTARIAPRAEQVDGTYCSYVLASSIGSKQVANYLKGAAQPGLNCGDIEKFLIPLPPLPEQRAIAAALSDVDALLGGLDRLIAKKRDLKQAAMQQLLTGQTRLPGFSGAWEVKRLGEIGEISSAGVDKKLRRDEAPVRLVNYLDVYHKDFIYSHNLTHWVTAPAHQLRRCAVKKGDVFFTPTSELRNDIGLSAVAMEDIPDAAYSYHVARLRLHEPWDLRFRTYAFKTRAFLDQAETLCDGNGTRYVISQGKFRSMIVSVPPVAEQSAIAAVLSDMDAELAALEARRDKTRDLKQAMMQELLTGRTRLA
jgi:type I restriction enzyme S subunit